VVDNPLRVVDETKCDANKKAANCYGPHLEDMARQIIKAENPKVKVTFPCQVLTIFFIARRCAMGTGKRNALKSTLLLRTILCKQCFGDLANLVQANTNNSTNLHM
jgi:hypothetical protein